MAVNKVVDPSAAANAYAKSLTMGQSGAAGGDGVSFSDFLGGQIRDSIQTLKSSETLSAQAVAGNANMSDVIQAAKSAEMTLDTVIAARDRLVGAYQELMRSSI